MNFNEATPSIITEYITDFVRWPQDRKYWVFLVSYFISCLWSWNLFFFLKFILFVTAASSGINLFPALCCTVQGSEWISVLFPMKNGSKGKWPGYSHPEHRLMSALPESPNIFQDCSWSRPWFSIAFESRVPQSQQQFIELGTNVMYVSEHLFFLQALWGKLCYMFLYIFKSYLLDIFS